MNREIVKFLRKSYQMNQRDFAKAVNCSYALIALVELGKRRITANLEEKIKSAFDLDDKKIDTIASMITEISKGLPPLT